MSVSKSGKRVLAYGPSAGGALRKFADDMKAELLTDLPREPVDNWVKFSLDTLDQVAKSNGKILFDLSHVKEIEGILNRTSLYASLITGQELLHIRDYWGDKFKRIVKFYYSEPDNREVQPPWEQ